MSENTSPSGMKLPESDLELSPKPQKATKIRKEVRVAVIAIAIVVILGIVFGISSKGKRQGSSAAAPEDKPVQSAANVADKSVEDMQQQAAQERRRKAEQQAQTNQEAPIPPGDPARDLNLPPTRISRSGAGPAGAAAGNNGQLSPAQQRALAAQQELDQAMKAPLGKGGAGGTADLSAAGRSGPASVADILKDELALRNTLASGAGNGTSPGSSSQTSGGGDDQNMQGDKAAFLASARKIQEPAFQAVSRVKALSRYEIKAGWDIPATLEQAINSDLPGEVRGIVRENVYDTATGHYLLIPQGSRVIGAYNSRVAYGQNGIQVAWYRLIYPDGSSVDLGGLNGQDVRGLSGFRDKVDNHYLRLIGFALMTSAFAAGIELSQNNNNTGYYLTPQQAATQAVGQQVGQLGVEVTRRNLNIQPTVKIGIGYRFTIRVRKDLIFDQPYREQAALWK